MQNEIWFIFSHRSLGLKLLLILQSCSYFGTKFVIGLKRKCAQKKINIYIYIICSTSDMLCKF